MDQEKLPRFGKRHVQILLMFVLYSIAFAVRSTLPVAIVAMTEKTSPNPDVKVFEHWDNKSILLSTFYWGYFWLQIAAGNLGRVYGTKYFLMGAMFVNSVICCLAPWVVTSWDWKGLIAIRVLQGVSQGFFFPSINNVLSRWSPVSERAVLGNIAFSGAIFGTVITMPVVGLVSPTWYGWPLAFYIFGAAGLIFTIFFYFLAADSPSTHPSISIAEREYIESNLEIEEEKRKIPLKQILTNVPFWVVLIVQVGQYFSNLVIMLETPTYLNKVMKFDITSNGFISALPSIVGFLSTLLFGYLADLVINKNLLSILSARKMFTLIGSIFPAATILVLGFCNEDTAVVAIIMLVLNSGFSSACGGGALINHIDLSPNFAGVLIGIINSVATFFAISGPVAVQYLVTDETDRTQWLVIFIIAAVVYSVPAVFYVILASADAQPFDSEDNEDIQKKKERLKKISVISALSM